MDDITIEHSKIIEKACVGLVKMRRTNLKAYQYLKGIEGYLCSGLRGRSTIGE